MTRKLSELFLKIARRAVEEFFARAYPCLVIVSCCSGLGLRAQGEAGRNHARDYFIFPFSFTQLGSSASCCAEASKACVAGGLASPTAFGGCETENIHLPRESECELSPRHQALTKGVFSWDELGLLLGTVNLNRGN